MKLVNIEKQFKQMANAQGPGHVWQITLLPLPLLEPDAFKLMEFGDVVGLTPSILHSFLGILHL